MAKKKRSKINEASAQYAVDFIKTLKHTKGKWAGVPFNLLPWQEKGILRPLFGTLKPDGTRQFRTVYIEVPKKNGKTEFGSAIALYLLMADGEMGGEVYCLDPSTLILCHDLRWRPIDKIKVGDELIGMDEYPSAKGIFRKLQSSKVLSKSYQRGDAYRLTFENGRSVVCSGNHRWFAKYPIGEGSGWRTTDQLGPDHRIQYLGQPWSNDDSWESGYLAGVFDGEASFHSPRAPRAAIRMQFAQRPGTVLDKVIDLLNTKGFSIKQARQHCSKDVMYVELSGLYDVLRFLGQIRPARFLQKHKQLWSGKAPNRTKGFIRIEKKELIGNQRLVDIETSTGTFIAEGLMSHNSAAADREQASLVYRPAASMVRQSKPLSKRLKVLDSQKRIVHYESGSFYHVLSSDVPTKHGLNVHGCIIDELHAQPNRDLYDVLTDSSGDAREQPVFIFLTTAGYDRRSVCWEVHEYARKVRDGIINDPTFLPVIYSADPQENWDEVDWKSKKIWRLANPSLGEIIKMERVEEACKKAQEIPAKENTFKRLRLNIWTQQVTKYIPMDKWNLCNGLVDPLKLKGRACFAGLDLASNRDVAAFVLVFPPREDYEDEGFSVLPYFWIPKENMEKRVRNDKVPYDQWVKEGLIEATDGDYIDYKAIWATIEKAADDFDLKEVAYDRWGMAQLSQDLIDEGYTVVPFGQGMASMAAPTKELLRFILSKEINHGGNKILRWMADNVAVKTDAAGNVKPDKERSSEKIDGIVALIMALDRAIRNPVVKSVYSKRGIRWI